MRAHFEAQGGLLVLKLLDAQKRPHVLAPIRGRIKRFSTNSRRRLLRFMARLKMQGVRATFITLTFKGYPTNAEAKRALHAFMSYLSRNFPKASACWRMEYQERGAIHFHLLCFNLPYWPQKALGEVWTRITRETASRVDIRLVRSRRGVMHYVSKYIAKVEKKSGFTSFIQAPYLHGYKKWRKGRFWGYHNKKHLPLGQKFEGVLINDNLIKKLSNAAWEIIGSETRYNSVSFHLFTDRAASLWKLYIAKGGLTIDEWRNSQQVTRREYTDMAYITSHFSERDFKNDYEKHKVSVSRPRSARSVQPCTRDWVSQRSFLNRATGELSFRPKLC